MSQNSTRKRSLRLDARPVNQLDIKFSTGGLGDSIARLPTIEYILDNYPHIKKIRLFAQDYFKEIVEHLYSPEKVEFVEISRIKEALAEKRGELAMHADPLQYTTMHTHLTHHAFGVLVDETPSSPHAYNYLQFDLNRLPTILTLKPQTYIVLTTGYTAKNREFPASEINKLAQWCLIKGYTPVFLGKQQMVYSANKEPAEAVFDKAIDTSVGVDLIDKTTLLEAAKVLGNAAAVVGVDNGLLHLAGMTKVPIVAGYTSVTYEHRMPIRHGMIGWNVSPVSAKISCAPCQTQGNFINGFDFRTCYYGDYECVNEMTARAFISRLELLCR